MVLEASIMIILAQGGGAYSMLLPLVAIMFLFYFLIIKPEQRKQRQHSTMLASLKKDDRVLTASGIYGVVTNVHRDADKVTIKVDESTNAKLHVTLGSIARVLGADQNNQSETSQNPS